LQKDGGVGRLRCRQAGQLAADVRVALALQAAIQPVSHPVQAHVLHRLICHSSCASVRRHALHDQVFKRLLSHG